MPSTLESKTRASAFSILAITPDNSSLSVNNNSLRQAVSDLFESAKINYQTVSAVSCGGSDDDDVATVNAASVIASSYFGTLKPIGFSDAPAACYVTLTRLSSKTIRLDRLLCEKFDVDLNPVNLTIVDNGNGRYTLESETSKSIGGTYYQGQLTLTYQNRLGVTFSFTGSKD